MLSAAMCSEFYLKVTTKIIENGFKININYDEFFQLYFSILFSWSPSYTILHRVSILFHLLIESISKNKIKNIKIEP